MRSPRGKKRQLGTKCRQASGSSSSSSSPSSGKQKKKREKKKVCEKAPPAEKEKSMHRSGSPRRPRRRQSSNDSRSDSRSSSKGVGKVSEDESEVHVGVLCDGCGQKPIKGPRFKCGSCKNANLCHRCYPKRAKFHKSGHKFYVMKVVNSAIGVPPSGSPGREPSEDSVEVTKVTKMQPPPPRPEEPSSEDEAAARKNKEEGKTAETPRAAAPEAPEEEPTADEVSAQKMQEMCASLGKTFSKAWQKPMEEEQQKRKLKPKKQAKPTQQEEKKQKKNRKEQKEEAAPIKDMVDKINSGTFPTIGTDIQKKAPAPDEEEPDRKEPKPASKEEAEEAAEAAEAANKKRKKELPNFVKGEKVEVFSNSRKEWLEGVVNEVQVADAIFPNGAFKVTSAAGTKWVGAETARAVIKKKAVTVRLASGAQELTTLVKQVEAAGEAVKKASEQAALQKAAVGQPRAGQWLPPGGRCSECRRKMPDGISGIVCHRKRLDGSDAGCSKGVCWRCMKPKPDDCIGKVRCAKTEFEKVGPKAWWMHEACMTGSDEKDYFVLNLPVPA